MADPRPIGVFDSGVGGLTVLREIVRRIAGRIDGLPRRQRARAVRRPLRRRGPGLLDRSRSTCSPSATSRRIVVACNTSTAVAHRRRCGGATTCRSSASSGPGASAAALATRNRRVGVIATPATIRSHAYFARDQGREPGGRGLRARDADPRPAGRGRRADRADRRGRRRRGARAAPRRARRRRRIDLPAAARCDRSTRCCSAAPTTRCCGRSSRRRSATAVAIVDSATATASALAELLEHQRARAPTRATPTARRPAPTHPPTHLQLTTGDAGTFHALAGRLFGSAFPDVEQVELGGRRPDDRRRRETGRRRAAVVARRPRLAGRLPDRLGARRRGDGRRAACRDGRRGAAWSTGRRSSGSRSAGSRGAPGRSTRPSCAPPNPPTPRRWRGSCPALSTRARQPSCRASSSGPASSTGPAGSAPTRAPSRSLIGKLETDLLDQVIPPGGGLAKATMALANRWVTTRQLGLPARVHGHRASSASTTSRCCRPRRRPAGCCSSRRTSGRRRAPLGVPLGPFRTWIALHETTHAFEFEAHPWLRPYLAERLERQLTLFGKRRPRAGPRGDPRASAGRSAARPAGSTGWSG